MYSYKFSYQNKSLAKRRGISEIIATIVGFADGTQQIRVSTSADLGRDNSVGGTGDTDAERFLFQIPFTAQLRTIGYA